MAAISLPKVVCCLGGILGEMEIRSPTLEAKTLQVRKKNTFFIWCDWHGLRWQLNFYFHVLFVEHWAKTNVGVRLKVMYSNIFSQREVLFRWLKVDCWRGRPIVSQPSVYFCFYLRVPITWRHAAKRGFVWAKSKFINNKRDRIV